MSDIIDRKNRFIVKARAKFGNKYDYSYVEYKGAGLKVKIVCPKHGSFTQRPNAHLSSVWGCTKCGKELCKVSKSANAGKLFISKAISRHNGKYTYDKAVYRSAHDKLVITCPIHGDYLQEPARHLNGSGCYYCGKESMARKKINKAKASFVLKANKVHRGQFDYSKTIYTNSSGKIVITCPSHGDFTQTANSHLSGAGCPHCAIEKNDGGKVSFDEFLKKCRDFFPSGEIIPIGEWKGVIGTNRIKYKCPKHGWQTSSTRVFLKRRACRACLGRVSNHELAVERFLLKERIVFKKEHIFPDCRYKNPLKFDFFIPEHGLLIEVNGIQHYKPIDFFGGEAGFSERIKRDTIKENYVAARHSLRLLKISHKEIKCNTYKAKIKKALNGSSHTFIQTRLAL